MKFAWGSVFCIKFKNTFATLVDTSKLYGGLNQMILRCRFLLTLFCLGLGKRLSNAGKLFPQACTTEKH